MWYNSRVNKEGHPVLTVPQMASTVNNFFSAMRQEGKMCGEFSLAHYFFGGAFYQPEGNAH